VAVFSVFESLQVASLENTTNEISELIVLQVRALFGYFFYSLEKVSEPKAKIYKFLHPKGISSPCSGQKGFN
jgi:hypothetical protein